MKRLQRSRDLAKSHNSHVSHHFRFFLTPTNRPALMRLFAEAPSSYQPQVRRVPALLRLSPAGTQVTDQEFSSGSPEHSRIDTVRAINLRRLLAIEGRLQ